MSDDVEGLDLKRWFGGRSVKWWSVLFIMLLLFVVALSFMVGMNLGWKQCFVACDKTIAIETANCLKVF